jgi:hypothetical protein
VAADLQLSIRIGGSRLRFSRRGGRLIGGGWLRVGFGGFVTRRHVTPFTGRGGIEFGFELF